MMNGPAILVSGGAGYIGSHVVWGLTDRGARTVVIDDLSTGSADVLPPGVPLVVGDVGDRPLLDETLRKYDVSAVVHFAGKILVAESVKAPLYYYTDNTSKSCSLFSACADAAVRHIIFSSSAAVYGEPAEVPIDEESPIAPLSPYGASKAMAERMLIDAATAHNFTCCILRYFNVAGADPRGRSGQMTRGATHLIKVACEVVTGKRRSMPVFGSDYPTPDGTCIRDYIHVSDLADAHILALDHLAFGRPSRVFNCGYGKGSSVLEVLRAVEAVSGIAVDHEIVGRRPGDPAVLVAKADRIRSELGWTPRLDRLEAMIESALAWESRKPHGAPGAATAESPLGA